MTLSFRPSSSMASSPGCAVPVGSTRMPEWSSPMPSSSAAQIMPSDVRPYVLRAEIVNPPGSTAPGSATTTESPSTKFVAPQMTLLTCSGPTSTWQ